MSTMVSELHSGEHVRTYITPDKGVDVVSDYVARGFDIVQTVTTKTVRLASGNAVVVVTKDV